MNVTKILFITITIIIIADATQSKDSQILKLWTTFPLKLLHNTTMLQKECRNALEDVFRRAEKLDITALKVLDSTGKLPSGILNGNVNQYGDFDQCLGVQEAQYCLVDIDLDAFWKPEHKAIRNLVHSHYAFSGDIRDPNHRVPSFKMIRWGFCIPAKCSPNDLKHSLEDNFEISAEIRPGMCQKSEKTQLKATFAQHLTTFYFLLLLLTIALSSLIDYFYVKQSDFRESTRGKLLMCFSLKKNISSLFRVNEESSDEIAGLHGMRVLNVFALLMSHKSISLFYNPYINRTFIIDKYSRPWTLLVKNAIIYTDSFLLLSGLLNANALLTDLVRRGTMDFTGKIKKRLFRILPSFITLILFCTYVLPFLGSGPLWPSVIDHHSFLCKKYMWRNVLFVHNFFKFEDMCLTHTHQIGIDMQLFLVTPIFVYLFWKSKKLGAILLISVASISTVLRFIVTQKHELNTIVYFGITVKKMFDTANLSYILPTHRATIYLIGVLTAFILKFWNKKIQSKILSTFLWCFFLVLFFGSWFGPYHMALRDYVYDKNAAAFISAFTPIFWGSSLAFGIYVTNHKIAGLLGDFLTWKYFQIGTRLSYALYLVQFPIFFFNVGKTRHSDEYQYYYQLQIFETSAIIVSSIILVLFVEMPFKNVYSVIFEEKRKSYIAKAEGKNEVNVDQRKVKFG